MWPDYRYIKDFQNTTLFSHFNSPYTIYQIIKVGYILKLIALYIDSQATWTLLDKYYNVKHTETVHHSFTIG
jgi:hypothetical protein